MFYYNLAMGHQGTEDSYERKARDRWVELMTSHPVVVYQTSAPIVNSQKWEVDLDLTYGEQKELDEWMEIRGYNEFKDFTPLKETLSETILNSIGIVVAFRTLISVFNKNK